MRTLVPPTAAVFRSRVVLLANCFVAVPAAAAAVGGVQG